MEEMQKDEGLNLLEMIRILLQKIKLLILVVVIGAASGACFGYWKYANVKNYGTSIEFYINPEKPKEIGASSSTAANAVGSQYGVYGAYGRHVMDAIVKLLSSESFAEQLMLGSEALPCVNIEDAAFEGGWYTLTEAPYREAEKQLKSAETEWGNFYKFEEPIKLATEKLQDEWAKAGQSSVFSVSNYNKLKNTGNAPETLIEAYEEYVVIEDQRLIAYTAAEKQQKTTDSAVEIVLDEWRKSEKYKEHLELFNESVVYSYLGAKEEVEDVNNLARSFIYVDINVLNDEAFADVLLERVKTVVPEYIKKNMIVPTDYEGTSCTRITRTNDIEYLNPNLARNQAIKYGFLLAFAAGVIAAVIIIFIDTQDKRLRDHEVITRKFNVPVLGIVPTIEEMNQAVEMKKQAMKKQGKGVK